MIHKNGLLPLKHDRRDYSYHKTFGAVVELGIPDNFMVAEPLGIKNQIDSDLCSAFSATADAENRERVEFSPEWFFAKEKEILGDPKAYGADLRTPMKAGVKYGFLPKNLAPFTLQEKGRDFCADWNNWPFGLDLGAAQYRKTSFFKVENFAGDMFDSIRQVLWKNKDSNEGVLVGSDWYAEWSDCAGGVIPKAYSYRVAQHMFLILGTKLINGEVYLVIQNSEGPEFGDHGLFYFPREVVNKEFKYGAFCYVKNPPEKIKTVSILQDIINAIKIWAAQLH